MNVFVRSLWRLIPENERAVLLSMAPHFRQRHIERVLKGRARYQPCFDEHRALFIHVPKSAGRSIVRGLFNVRSVEHAPADWYQLLDPDKYGDYFKFTLSATPGTGRYPPTPTCSRAGRRRARKTGSGRILSAASRASMTLHATGSRRITSCAMPCSRRRSSF